MSVFSNLTNYKPPAPDDYYLGQRRLTSEIRDLYGQLIDGMQGTSGQLKTGGDGAGRGAAGQAHRRRSHSHCTPESSRSVPMVRANINFDIPEFAGNRARV